MKRNYKTPELKFISIRLESNVLSVSAEGNQNQGYNDVGDDFFDDDDGFDP